jgi:hypothetical protein
MTKIKLFLFFPSSLLCLVVMHCDIYTVSYNILNTSYLNLPPLQVSFFSPCTNSKSLDSIWLKETDTQTAHSTDFSFFKSPSYLPGILSIQGNFRLGRCLFQTYLDKKFMDHFILAILWYKLLTKMKKKFFNSVTCKVIDFP